ncbi:MULTISPECIES: D-aminoacyl-tRNA deacylase [Cyanophyceae]|uniref:D-aminoacyl-tRNA deacylase n=1 Tax=Picosynechococcus sp. (strain ATCC 27264 / PCC 7002 / PR-6) TaxID=32049 RepID=DTD_PICP2|nr:MULTISPECIES: D-aminoacyl-tRNA deacylase [Cyanophyceae]B1XM75.1 RecName: Full=D-aminoacyl-tRNA deacylase; Short=DTD; AltName: Full=Gly-tRNA(Ala) deacylase [Picosynechococcus sp. PCC 7002]ACA98222.1 D-tyrosyl-tRNA(Tyr) deacylase [Picosynechococcus sp. PCC 7002]ANV89366.1 D-tyrosyl-tRNA(Tyr) deacylase [Picosynechococcus sp. PCC 8807]QCS48864.1 D-tyrosyl-tRNA(Tyr) deacylase [Picosynechococcus sp. PCC 11901]SMH44639.1 D-tyrosyl-tRNA(Tyr) deacylase [Picosynechococcus sp. OG1]SMQ79771.1 D-tyrosy
MKIVLQRVQQSHVSVNQHIVGQINQGLTLLVGISPTDTDAELQWLARKCLDLRLFPDPEGNPWQASIQDIQGEILVVSQFTLYGDCRKGRRPSFSGSAKPDQAEQIYEKFVAFLRQSGLKIETGQFGAMMQVEISNDGPVTLLLEREAKPA